MIKHLFTIMFSLMLFACASPPPVPQQSYWEIVAEDYMHNGLDYYQRQQFRQALNQFSRALNTYQRFNDVEGELNSRINLAKTSIALDQLDAAGQQIVEARRIIAAHGMKNKSVYLDIMQASIAIQQQQPAEAAAILDGYAMGAGLPGDVSSALLINKIRLGLLQQQDVSPLIQQLENSAGQQPKVQPRLWRFQAQQADEQKDYARSDEFFTRALQRYRNDADAMGVLATLKEWAAALARRQDWQAAAVRYEDMYKTAASLKRQQQMVTALQGLVLVYQQQNNQPRVEWARQQMDKLKN